MIICFDLRGLQIGHENRGIGMFIKSILEHLPNDEHTYIFYAFDKNDPIKELSIVLNNDYQLVQAPIFKTALKSPLDIIDLIKLTWHSFRQLRPFKPDVFVQFDFALGLPRWKKTKKVVVAYDLIPLIKKQEYLPGFKFAWQHTAGKKAKLRALVRSVYYRLKYSLNYRVYQRADSIISISESTTLSFVNLLDIPIGKLHTIVLAPVISNKKTDDSLVKKIAKPYIFYIGGTDSRKRIEDIVYAFNIARGRGVDIALVFAGNEFNNLENLPNIVGRNAIIESSYRDDIHLIGFVSDEQKMALYNHAHAFIFCTMYEGFGLPIIEAMSASCPVISYNNSSIPEAAGEAALLVETGDYVGVANQIIALQDRELRQELIKKGIRQAKKFNWAKYVDEFKKVLYYQ